MDTLKQVLRSIQPANEAAMDAARARWDERAKPLGSLGTLEDMVVRIAGVTGSSDMRIDRRALIVTCADNGVTARGVSGADASVTRTMAAAIGAGKSSVCVMARHAGCEVVPVDVGMLPGPAIPGVEARAVRPGTGDITVGPAMSRDECVRAVELGIQLVREQAERGTQLILVGEMGIGNTTTSCAVASALYGRSPRSLVGPGAGLSYAGMARKIAALEAALAVNRPHAGDVLGTIAAVGGLDIATLCGICLGGALCRMPILLDGIITLVAAVCATRLCPDCADVLLVSHVSAEPMAPLLLDELDLAAPIDAGLRLGEGTGAVAALALLDLALAAYRETGSFDELAIYTYDPRV